MLYMLMERFEITKTLQYRKVIKSEGFVEEIGRGQITGLNSQR